MRRIPRIKSVMTPFPYSIALSATLEDAQAMMAEHDIRHLPVCEGHTVVGILSERDTRVALELRAGDASLRVGDVCTREAYLVDLDRRLDEVCGEMAERRIGAAIVMRGDKLAGILTTTDVCRLLATTLREVSGPEDDEVA